MRKVQELDEFNKEPELDVNIKAGVQFPDLFYGITGYGGQNMLEDRPI